MSPASLDGALGLCCYNYWFLPLDKICNNNKYNLITLLRWLVSAFIKSSPSLLSPSAAAASDVSAWYLYLILDRLLSCRLVVVCYRRITHYYRKSARSHFLPINFPVYGERQKAIEKINSLLIINACNHGCRITSPAQKSHVSGDIDFEMKLSGGRANSTRHWSLLLLLHILQSSINSSWPSPGQLIQCKW